MPESPYKLTQHMCKVTRTTWWKDENKDVVEAVWYLTGGGFNRPATDVEIELGKQIIAIEARLNT